MRAYEAKSAAEVGARFGIEMRTARGIDQYIMPLLELCDGHTAAPETKQVFVPMSQQLMPAPGCGQLLWQSVSAEHSTEQTPLLLLLDELDELDDVPFPPSPPFPPVMMMSPPFPPSPPEELPN